MEESRGWLRRVSEIFLGTWLALIPVFLGVLLVLEFYLFPWFYIIGGIWPIWTIILVLIWSALIYPVFRICWDNIQDMFKFTVETCIIENL
jgi:hypothetical protein